MIALLIIIAIGVPYILIANEVAKAFRAIFGEVPGEFAWMVVFWPAAVVTGQLSITVSDEDEDNDR